MSQPLIVTLLLDEAAQAFYEDLRIRHFPPACNLIPAHLTLFHNLPDEERTHKALREAAASTSVFQLTKANPRSIGRGVAVFFDSPPLASLHTMLSNHFDADLIPQDRQRLRPHIVVQNKVDPATARQTLAELPTSFIEPQALGLTIWRYLGGPWEHLTDLPFRLLDAPSVSTASSPG